TATQFLDRHLEGDAGAGRRLLEDHHQRLAGQRRGALGLVPLQRTGAVQDTPERAPVGAVDVEEMAQAAHDAALPDWASAISRASAAQLLSRAATASSM